MIIKNGLISLVIILSIILSSFTTISLSIADTASLENTSDPKDDKIIDTIPKVSNDQNNNCIADNLEAEISEMCIKNKLQDYVNVTVELKNSPTNQDKIDFVSSGGILTTSLWADAINGFGGTIPYYGILSFSKKCSNLSFIEKEAIGNTCVAYASQQIGARSYVWTNLSLQGDNKSSTAIIDTGIDSTHVDFAPGFGDQNFSKKIVGWHDEGGASTIPYDDFGHGSHVAGLTAGNGFYSFDSSGRATATFSDKFDASGLVWAGGPSIMVNQTGNVFSTIEWVGTGNASLTSFCWYKTTSSLSEVNVTSMLSTPSQNVNYSLGFNVASIPPGNCYSYTSHLYCSGVGNISVVITLSWPCSQPTDGFPTWTGIAPQSKLVGVKVTDSAGSISSTTLINAINWIIQNKERYHITVASLSLGFSEEKVTLDSAVLNLINNGVATIVSGGNYGSGYNSIFTPGSVDEVITVGAMDQTDKVTSYSSQGGTSQCQGKTIKPDIIAPGGSFYLGDLLSADTNYNDATGSFTDFQSNDATAMSGTSMSAPIIAGCAQILIQAMGGYDNWTYSRSQALQPKMLLLMTATETYPNTREGTSSIYSPSLDRGAKDRHEGFGRVNLDAAVDAIQKSYIIGEPATGNLGKSPTFLNISVVGQKLAWARNVQLTAGLNYNLSLTMTTSADFDLYLYNNTGTSYGEPAIVASSTNSSTGIRENISFSPTYTGSYYIVVKRATATTADGNFTLSSSSQVAAPVLVTLTTPGLQNAANAIHYLQNGNNKTGNIIDGVFQDYADLYSNLTIDNQIAVSANQKYVLTGFNSFLVKPNQNRTHENIIIESSHPYSNNYNHTWSITRSDAAKIRVHFSYIITEVNYDYVRVWTNNSYSISRSGTWAPFWSDWCEGNTFKVRLTSDGSRVCDGLFIDAIEWETSNQNQNNYSTTFKTNYYLTVNSPYGTPGGSGWYEAGTTAYATLNTDTKDNLDGSRAVFVNWLGDATGTSYSDSQPIIMTGPKTATANWNNQYSLSFAVSPSGSGTVNPSGNVWNVAESITITATPSANYQFSSWTTSSSALVLSNPTSSSTTLTVNGTGTITANFIANNGDNSGSSRDNGGSNGNSGSSGSSSSSRTPIKQQPPPPVINDTTPNQQITIIQATTQEGLAVNLRMNGNITSTNVTNAQISNPTYGKAIVSFTVNGPAGTSGFGNLTIPKNAVSNVIAPQVFIDGQLCINQGYIEDANNYYVWFTMQFDLHKVSIEFPKTTVTPDEFPLWTIGLVIAVVFSLIAGVIILKRGKSSVKQLSQ